MSGITLSSSPSWLQDRLVVVVARRRLALLVMGGLGALAIVVTLVAPQVLTPDARVGAAVGIAAVVIAAAVAMATDMADLTVRGRRHVVAAGAEVAAVVSSQSDDVTPLRALVERHDASGRLRLGVVAASRTAGAPAARAGALAAMLAADGKRVLYVDLTRASTGAAGLSDVVVGTHRLRDVVHFDSGVYLGRVTVGFSQAKALEGFDEWLSHLPSDLEVLIAVFPPLADPGALAAIGAVDVVLLQVEVDRTERVDLLAALDALDAMDQGCEVVLVDPSRRSHAEVQTTEDAAEADTEAHDDQGEAPTPVMPSTNVPVAAPSEAPAPSSPTAVIENPVDIPLDRVAERTDLDGSDDDFDLTPVVMQTETHTGEVAALLAGVTGRSASAASAALVAASTTVELPVVTAALLDESAAKVWDKSDASEAAAAPTGTRDRWLDPREVWSDLPSPAKTSILTDSDPAGSSVDELGMDVLTDEAIRTAAALQELAQRVWARQD